MNGIFYIIVCKHKVNKNKIALDIIIDNNLISPRTVKHMIYYDSEYVFTDCFTLKQLPLCTTNDINSIINICNKHHLISFNSTWYKDDKNDFKAYALTLVEILKYFNYSDVEVIRMLHKFIDTYFEQQSKQIRDQQFNNLIRTMREQ